MPAGGLQAAAGAASSAGMLVMAVSFGVWAYALDYLCAYFFGPPCAPQWACTRAARGVLLHGTQVDCGDTPVSSALELETHLLILGQTG